MSIILYQFLVQPSQEDTPNTGIPYKNLQLDGPVLQDMTFDPDKEHVYVMTQNTVSDDQYPCDTNLLIVL